MKNEPYPGKLAGNNQKEQINWLFMTKPLQRFTISIGLEVVGHIQINQPSKALAMHLKSLPNKAQGDQNVLHAELSRLFVSPKMRNQLLATKLLQHAENYARSINLRPVLEVSSYLSPAINLYLKNGYHQVSSRASSLNNDTLLIFTKE
ncbi:MAG: GNAT family N-acetyltransferase [Candidatus Paceibacterota bacterium]